MIIGPHLTERGPGLQYAEIPSLNDAEPDDPSKTMSKQESYSTDENSQQNTATESSLEDQYHERVDDLAELHHELRKFDRQINDTTSSEEHRQTWKDLVHAVEEHVGEIGLPIKPLELEDHSAPYVTAPSYQGDHIGVNIEWRDDGLYVNAYVLPHFAGPEAVFYAGFVSDLSESQIEKCKERAKRISPEEALQ